eukprot:6481097-Amphidinium_carterae.1
MAQAARVPCPACMGRRCGVGTGRAPTWYTTRRWCGPICPQNCQAGRVSPGPRLLAVSPELARSQHGWLTRPAFAYIQSTSHSREVCSTLLGVPQGDVLSTLGFCAGLEVALQRFRAMQGRDNITCLDDQYVDDGVIECAQDDVERTYANLEAALAP